MIRNRDKQDDLVKGDCRENKILSERAVRIKKNPKKNNTNWETFNCLLLNLKLKDYAGLYNFSECITAKALENPNLESNKSCHAYIKLNSNPK
jgi:hypothetical protein